MRLLRPEPQPHVLLACAREHDQERPISGSHHAFAQIGRLHNRQRCRREIVHDHKPIIGLEVVRFDDAGQLRELISRCRLDQNLPAPILEHHREAIVGKYLIRDLGYLREHRSDVEHTGNRAQQLDRAFDAGRAFALHSGLTRRFRQPLVRQRDGDVIGKALDERQIVRRVLTAMPRQQGEDANQMFIDANGRCDTRPQASLVARYDVEQVRNGGIAQRAATLLATDDFGTSAARACIQAEL